jgi:hypothetical protein
MTPPRAHLRPARVRHPLALALLAIFALAAASACNVLLGNEDGHVGDGEDDTALDEQESAAGEAGAAGAGPSGGAGFGNAGGLLSTDQDAIAP